MTHRKEDGGVRIIFSSRTLPPFKHLDGREARSDSSWSDEDCDHGSDPKSRQVEYETKPSTVKYSRGTFRCSSRRPRMT